MKKLRFIAMCLAWLVVSIPFISAQELNIVRISGKDSAPGFAKTRDQLGIEVTAKLPREDIIDREQVRLYVEDSYAFFDNCTKLANTTLYKCVFVEPEFEAYEPVEFLIKLFDDDDREVLSKKERLQLDALPPVLKNFTVEPLITKGEVRLWYVAEDYGLEFGSPTSCSGVKSVVVTQGNQTLVTETGKLGVCGKENALTLTLSQSGKVCAAVTDFSNQASVPVCAKEVRVDKNPPDIRDISIADASGLELTHVKKGEERVATVTITISDDGKVDRKEVRANFASISRTFTDFAGPEVVNGDLYVWKNVPITEPQTCKVSVVAKDTLGNSAGKDFACSISGDNTPPTIRGIVSEKLRGNLSLHGFGDSVVIEIEDLDDKKSPGAGLDGRNAYLDLRELGLSPVTRADDCTRQGALWRCSWLLNPPERTPEKEYKISVTASDDLENPAAQQPFTILYDGTPPEQPKVVNFSVLKGAEKTSGAIVGDTLQYTVRSKGFVKAEADFSSIGGRETLAKYCTGLGNETADCLGESCDCVFEGLIEQSGPYTADFVFAFSDDAGNKAVTDASVEIYGLENETKTKYWKAQTTCSPSLIDRSIASKINSYVSCRVHLNSSVKNIAPLSIKGPESPSECKGPVDLNINDIYMVNNAEGSKDPIIMLKLEAKDYYVNSLNFTCPLSIITKRVVKAGDQTKTFVTPLPQILNASIKLQFYNEPLKDVYGNVDRQIEKAMNDGLANQEWLGQLRKFLYYAEIICQIKTMITGIIGAFYAVVVTIGVAADALKPAGPAAPAGWTLEEAKAVLCNGEETFDEGYKNIVDFLDSICSIINCQATTGGKGKWSVPGVGGGGLPHCEFVDRLVKLIPLIGTAAEEAGASSLSIKDSLLWSTICFCLPGIVYNLEKLRQINCFKAVCLNDQVKQEGYPASYCNEMHGYLLCQYVVGQIFAAIPLSSFFNKLIDMIVTLLTDPVALFTTAIGAVCLAACYVPNIGVFIGCALFKTVAQISEAAMSLRHMTKTKGYFSTPPGSQYCNRMEKIKKELKETKKERTTGTPAASATEAVEKAKPGEGK